jgi:hypothetical protein
VEEILHAGLFSALYGDKSQSYFFAIDEGKNERFIKQNALEDDRRNP